MLFFSEKFLFPSSGQKSKPRQAKDKYGNMTFSPSLGVQPIMEGVTCPFLSLKWYKCYIPPHVGRHFNNFSVKLQQGLARGLRNLRNAETFRYQIVLRRKGKINGLVARRSESFRCHKRKFHNSRRVTFSLKPKSCLLGPENVK
jgi:hypothetical protein